MASIADAKASGASSSSSGGGGKGGGGQAQLNGQEVTTILKNGTKRVGRLWCMERDAGVCVLDCPKESSTTLGNTCLRLVRLSHVRAKGFKVMAKAGGPAGVAKPSAPGEDVDAAALQQRYRDAVARQQKRVAQIGRGVSEEAQYVFDNLSKTLDCRWKDKTILVNHLGVRVKPPYQAANVSGKDGKACGRVKMMIEKFVRDFKKLKA